MCCFDDKKEVGHKKLSFFLTKRYIFYLTGYKDLLFRLMKKILFNI